MCARTCPPATLSGAGRPPLTHPCMQAAADKVKREKKEFDMPGQTKEPPPEVSHPVGCRAKQWVLLAAG